MTKVNKSKLAKRGFAHFATEKEAELGKKSLQKHYPKKKLVIEKEKRRNNKLWKKYCVCEYIPYVKKSRVKNSSKQDKVVQS
jgi:hypothetical protein